MGNYNIKDIYIFTNNDNWYYLKFDKFIIDYYLYRFKDEYYIIELFYKLDLLIGTYITKIIFKYNNYTIELGDFGKTLNYFKHNLEDNSIFLYFHYTEYFQNSYISLIELSNGTSINFDNYPPKRIDIFYNLTFENGKYIKHKFIIQPNISSFSEAFIITEDYEFMDYNNNIFEFYLNNLNSNLLMNCFKNNTILE